VTERVLRLFVSGTAASSERARRTLEHLKSSGLLDGWRLEFIDVLIEPQRAETAGVLATPTLACEAHARSRRIVGDLSDTTKMLEFLGIEARKQES
jgi:circadian clock protein KaiB